MIKEKVELFEDCDINVTTKVVNYYDNDILRWTVFDRNNKIIWTCHYEYKDGLLIEKRYYDSDFELKLLGTFEYEKGELIKYKFTGDEYFAREISMNEDLPVGTINEEVKVVFSEIGDCKTVDYLCEGELLKEIEYRKGKVTKEEINGVYVNGAVKYYYNDEGEIRMRIESLFSGNLNNLSAYEYEYVKGKLRFVNHEKDLIAYYYDCYGELEKKEWYFGGKLIGKSTYRCNVVTEDMVNCVWNKLKDIRGNE